ncbi:hypothetical protein BAXH7_02099 [Bacillus amyloliquefaciens XH7]|nr:hypothetical protein LL3_01475 [Bacillus amyloliquefaciens LL3]AEK89231.1 hypothetical protein BAXH7_02099 [Bacillus amyloliquefaciens XH7]KYC94501.1 hypothetical protein B425_1412 [Bacillus amyloliquefaciens]
MQPDTGFQAVFLLSWETTLWYDSKSEKRRKSVSMRERF